jgi:hypothetical protein
MRPILLALILSVAATPALALCPSLPDDERTNNVENRTALALCHQRELAVTTDQAADQARFNVELGNLEMEIQRQRVMQQQIIATWPQI